MDRFNYKVKTGVFEGPLDLLLDLVEKRKLFVNDVSLSEVTDDFIKYIESHEKFPIGESAEFIVIASTLMLVKSRSLLPMLELSEEEEASIEDLERRLVIYARVKELSINIKKLFGKNIIFEKTPSKEAVVVFSPDSKTNQTYLLSALNRVLESLPKKENLPKTVIRKMISLEETIEKLAERISRGIKMNFTDFYKSNMKRGALTHENKVMIIVGFLAMLELVKRGAIRVTQEAGGDIEMETENVGIPHYA
ncbi:MAG: segregation and condensation protein A [Parcubacteria bacterium C7867-005]|nr:MAG: segregation and condensation protein A [Parcubacteria bacterium C7867-005]